MSSSLRFPTNWVVYSNSYPLQPVNDSVPWPVNDQAVNDQAVNDQAVNDQAVNEQSVNEQSVNEQSVNEQSVTNNSVNKQSVNEQSVNEQSVNDQSVNDTSYVLEYFTKTPDEFNVPQKYGKLMKEYNEDNNTLYYLSRLHLNHGQLSCTSQLENGFIFNVTSPVNKKVKLTLIMSYGNYRKYTENRKITPVHTLNTVYDIIQPANRPVLEGKNRKKHTEEPTEVAQ